jgi:hypothetical protein
MALTTQFRMVLYGAPMGHIDWMEKFPFWDYFPFLDSIYSTVTQAWKQELYYTVTMVLCMVVSSIFQSEISDGPYRGIPPGTITNM